MEVLLVHEKKKQQKQTTHKQIRKTNKSFNETAQEYSELSCCPRQQSGRKH